MLPLIRNHSPFTVIVLFILMLMLKMQAILAPVAPVPPTAGMFLYGYIFRIFDSFLHGNAIGYTLISVMMIFGQAIYLSGISNKHKLFKKSGYLPAFLFICFTSMLPAFNHFGPSLIANWCLLLSLDTILGLPQQNLAQKRLFNAGFVLSIGILIQFSAIWFLVFFAASILLVRLTNLSGWLVAILGLLTPVYFAAALLFLVDKLPVLTFWPRLGLSLPRHIPHPIHLLTSVGTIMLYAALGIYTLQGQLGSLAISNRRSWGAVMLYTLAAVASAINAPLTLSAAWLLPLSGLALIAASALQGEVSKRFGTFMALSLIALVIFCQFTINR